MPRTPARRRAPLCAGVYASRDILAPVSSARRVLILALLCALSGAAVEPDAELRIEAPAELRVGARIMVPVLLDWDLAPDLPVIVSAHAEGRALEVVKGRLLRADAVDPEARPLRFELPLAATATGAAVLNVSALVYRCIVRCEAVRLEASQHVLVRDP